MTLTATDIRTGSIASATMRSVDRLPALRALAADLGVAVPEDIVPEGSPYAKDYSDDFKLAMAVARFEGIEDNDDGDAIAHERVSEVIVALIDHITDALPEGFFVGNHPHDPADLGLWAFCIAEDCEWDPDYCEDSTHLPEGVTL